MKSYVFHACMCILLAIILVGCGETKLNVGSSEKSTSENVSTELPLQDELEEPPTLNSNEDPNEKTEEEGAPAPSPDVENDEPPSSNIDSEASVQDDEGGTEKLNTCTASSDDVRWESFDEFHFPENFNLIWSGPPGCDDREALSHGFTHIDINSSVVPNEIPPHQRAMVWNVSIGSGTPWVSYIPWGNDMGSLQEAWEKRLSEIANDYGEEGGFPNVGIVVNDIERRYGADDTQESNDAILTLKNHPLTPSRYQPLTDNGFIEQYKMDMAALYAAPIQWLRYSGYSGKISSYDHPIVYRRYWEISPYVKDYYSTGSFTWDDWTTNPSVINYLFRNIGNIPVYPDNIDMAPGSPVVPLDFISTSNYLFYDYPTYEESYSGPRGLEDWNWLNAGDYLAYFLFQIEANAHRSTAPVIPFVWLRFHEGGTYKPVDGVPYEYVDIRPEMAEAMAIFLFFSGAKGAWLWDYHFGGEWASGSIYESFITGLERVSNYASMFEGDYELVAPDNPFDLMQEHKPVWRGIVKGGKILVAAHNPYADEYTITKMEIQYNGSNLGTITLYGHDIALELFTSP